MAWTPVAATATLAVSPHHSVAPDLAVQILRISSSEASSENRFFSHFLKRRKPSSSLDKHRTFFLGSCFRSTDLLLLRAALPCPRLPTSRPALANGGCELAQPEDFASRTDETDRTCCTLSSGTVSNTHYVLPGEFATRKMPCGSTCSAKGLLAERAASVVLQPLPEPL